MANHIDKYLLSKYIKEGGVGALIIFSAIFGIVFLPFIYFFNPYVLDVSFWQGIVLTLNGMLIVLAILCYLYAMQEDEASRVVPYYQTIPIFSFILAYFILGETITMIQFLGAAVIILGTIVLSAEYDLVNRFSFKKKVMMFMFTAAFFYALNSVIFKLLAIDIGFWMAIFWAILGKVIIGAIFFAFVKSYRDEFLLLIEENKVFILSLNSFNEAITLVAEMIIAYVTLLAPIAIVALVVDSFQPVFVFIIGVLLTIFAPNISEESIEKKDMIQKVAAILIILAGSFVLTI